MVVNLKDKVSSMSDRAAHVASAVSIIDRDRVGKILCGYFMLINPVVVEVTLARYATVKEAINQER